MTLCIPFPNVIQASTLVHTAAVTFQTLHHEFFPPFPKISCPAAHLMPSLTIF